jgi:hypothetical protein
VVKTTRLVAPTFASVGRPDMEVAVAVDAVEAEMADVQLG